VLDARLVFDGDLGVEVRISQQLDLGRRSGRQLRVHVQEARPLVEVPVVEEELVALGDLEAQSQAGRQPHLPVASQRARSSGVEFIGHVAGDEQVVVRVRHHVFDFAPRRPEVGAEPGVEDQSPVLELVLEIGCAGDRVGDEDVLADAQLAGRR